MRNKGRREIVKIRNEVNKRRKGKIKLKERIEIDIC
jgi:hypothetical protein